MAPEIVSGKTYDERVDVWAVGCTAYFLATGKFAFYDTDPDLMLGCISTCDYDRIPLEGHDMLK